MGQDAFSHAARRFLVHVDKLPRAVTTRFIEAPLSLWKELKR